MASEGAAGEKAPDLLGLGLGRPVLVGSQYPHLLHPRSRHAAKLIRVRGCFLLGTLLSAIPLFLLLRTAAVQPQR